MVFTSHIFVFYFLPLALGLYYLLPGRFRGGFLALASYVFYGWWSPWFLLLILASTLVDYGCGRVLTAPGATAVRRKAAVAVSVSVNLSLLGFFKYFMFLAESANALLGAAGAQRLPVLEIVLPIGISIYTFQSMSYTLDLYRGHARPAPSLLDFAAYVALFPQLIAGPIIRYRDIAEQLHARRHSIERVARGLAYFAFGFAKKVLLANNLGEIADAVFAAEAPPWHVAWVGVAAYAFQIYFDFSGYSEMAIGLGWMLGFRFPQNFNAPYHAESITDFWRRWHISLSTWLRDYLYVPLGGNRKGPRRTYANLAVTMLLGGLWHGAEWRFVVWGALHGGLLAGERALGKRTLYAALPRPLRIAFTFALVLVTWVFFRAASLPDALRYLGSMLGLIEPTAGGQLLAAATYGAFPLATLLAAALAVWSRRRTQDWIEAPGRTTLSPRLAAVSVALLVVAILEMSVQSHNPFLYFQF